MDYGVMHHVKAANNGALYKSKSEEEGSWKKMEKSRLNKGGIGKKHEREHRMKSQQT